MSNVISHPRVFLSHATEDKQRFVLDFASRLRQRGIDVWLDRWEIAPGDSLVEKIFEEGLKNAQAVLVIISQNSVNKKWVREELDASVVSKITKGTRLIPVILDDVAVPEALKHTFWLKVENPKSYDTVLDEIVATLFGTRAKPPLGPAPSFLSAAVHVPGLSKQDSYVLQLFCEAAVAHDALHAIRTDEIERQAGVAGIGHDQFLESAEVLDAHRYLEKAKVMAPIPPYYSVTRYGFDKYVRAAVPDFAAVYRGVASAILNAGKTTNREIASELAQDKLLLVEHALEDMESKGFIKLSKAIGRHFIVIHTSPLLKRFLASGA